MGYLDELRKQAEQKRLQEQADLDRQQQLEQVYKAQVVPALTRLFKYLYEVASHLNYIQPEAPITFHLTGYGKVDFRAKQYIIDPPGDTKHNFFLRIVYDAGKRLKFEKYTEKDAEAQAEFLWRHNIPFEYVPVRDAKMAFMRGVFELPGELYTELNFIADKENSAIRVKVKNFQVLGRDEYILRPEEVSEQFLDELAKYLTHTASGPDFIKRYEAKNFWAGKDKNPQDLIREQVLAEMRLKQEIEEKRRQQEEAQRQKAEAKSPPGAPANKPAQAPPKKGLFDLFKK